ncbi:MAG: DUF364 domain-containing protein [Methanoregula sp.]
MIGIRQVRFDVSRRFWKYTMNSYPIIDDLLAGLPEEPVPVRSVLVGAHWTAVCSTGCGLATTIAGDTPHDHKTLVRGVGHLHEKTAQELAAYALSENPLEASIGVAAINSLLAVDERDAVEINAAEVLMKRGAKKNIALVGHFPFIPRLRTVAGNLWVLEQHPTGDDFPAEAAGDLIPKADLVALTASALINHTMDSLLGLCKPDAQVLILGPSTPLSPVLFDHGATIIAGSRVIDETTVLSAVGQGATFQQVRGVRLLSFTRPGTGAI